jgi:acyl transferase domain-containing protein
MARGLYEAEPRIAGVIEECDAALAGRLQPGLKTLLLDPDSPAAAIERTEATQPALCAFGLALATLWRAWGISPSLVLGHMRSPRRPSRAHSMRRMPSPSRPRADA